MVIGPEVEESRIAPERRRETVARAWALQEKAVAEGLETWDLDRINAELARARRAVARPFVGPLRSASRRHGGDGDQAAR